MPRRPLYLMAKPPPEVRDLIWARPWTDKARPAELLHVTLLPFVDLADAPVTFLPTLINVLDGFENDMFRVVFDQIVAHRHVTLRGSERMAGVRSFQRRLTDHLRAHGFAYLGQPPTPHLTLRYAADGLGDEMIDPISWTVEEVSLIESVVREARHDEHARWRLRPKAG